MLYLCFYFFMTFLLILLLLLVLLFFFSTLVQLMLFLKCFIIKMTLTYICILILRYFGYFFLRFWFVCLLFNRTVRFVYLKVNEGNWNMFNKTIVELIVYPTNPPKVMGIFRELLKCFCPVVYVTNIFSPVVTESESYWLTVPDLFLFLVLPVVPVLAASGHPTPDSVSETGSGSAAALVRWTGNSHLHIICVTVGTIGTIHINSRSSGHLKIMFLLFCFLSFSTNWHEYKLSLIINMLAKWLVVL